MHQEIIFHHFIDSRGNPAGGHTYATGLCIHWQDGPLSVNGEQLEPSGCFVETVIEAAMNRLEFYQRTKFASKYNSLAISHLGHALHHLRERTEDREDRGVEGTHEA